VAEAKKRFKVTMTVFIDTRPEAKDDEIHRQAMMQIYLAAISKPVLVYEEIGEIPPRPGY
jgi:hypothetical protein